VARLGGRGGGAAVRKKRGHKKKVGSMHGRSVRLGGWLVSRGKGKRACSKKDVSKRGVPSSHQPELVRLKKWGSFWKRRRLASLTKLEVTACERFKGKTRKPSRALAARPKTMLWKGGGREKIEAMIKRRRPSQTNKPVGGKKGKRIHMRCSKSSAL